MTPLAMPNPAMPLAGRLCLPDRAHDVRFPGMALRVETRDLLNDRVRRAELGARGRETVLAEHSWDAIGARLEEIYHSLV